MSPQPSVPRPHRVSLPKLRVRAALSASIPRPRHQVSCLQTVPAQDQGPSVPRCCEHSAPPPPPPLAFPVAGGEGMLCFSLFRIPERAPLFRGTKAGDGEGRGPFGPVQAGPVRVKAILSAPLSSDDGFSLAQRHAGCRAVTGWAAPPAWNFEPGSGLLFPEPILSSPPHPVFLCSSISGSHKSWGVAAKPSLVNFLSSTHPGLASGACRSP